MIPDAAVRAAVKAYRAKVEWIDRHSRDDYGREDELGMTAALEAAAPHMLAGVEEFGIFRKGGDWHDAPMEKWSFTTRERAECAIRKFNDGESWLEVRSRIASPWEAAP